MKSFKQIREEALEKVKTNKVFSDKKSDENEKDPAFSKKGQIAKADKGELEYGMNNNEPSNKVKVTEDVDQEFDTWRSAVLDAHPKHADNIKFVSKPDAPHHVSAEVPGTDRSFGVFDRKQGKGEVLGEATDQKASLKAKIAHHEALALEANKQGDDAAVKHHQEKINTIKTKMANLVRNEETETLDEVSKSTLVSYIKKAARSAAEAGNVAGFKAGKEQPKYNVSDETPTEIKRHKGIALAARKLAENLLDEAANIRPDKPSASQPTSDHIAYHRSMVKYYKREEKAAHKAAIRGTGHPGAPNTFWKKGQAHQERADWLRKQERRGYPDSHLDHYGLTGRIPESVQMTGSIDQDAVKKHLDKICKKHGCKMDYLEKQLLNGKKVETEHTKDQDVATKVALDHLEEMPDYYEKLKKVEG